MDNYLEINKHLWNAKTPIHLESEMYDQETFLNGRSSLTKIELDILKQYPVAGKKVLHLQCHFGQDTISLQRMGAKTTGVDFSDVAIKKAQEINTQVNQDARFLCANVLELDQHHSETYDVIYTGFGIIGWHPDLKPWGKQISHFLKPGGHLIFIEFHPVVWMFEDDLKRIEYSYFNKHIFEEEEEGTYADRSADIKLKSVSWNHSLEEVFSALLDQQLSIKQFKEYDYSPFNCLNNMVACDDSNPGYYVKGYEGKLPMVYSLVCQKS